MSEPSQSSLAPALWYRRTTGFFGRMSVQYSASGIYAIIALYPLVYYLIFRKLPDWASKPIAIEWALFVALGYPAWSWLETLAFDRWLCETPMTDEQRSREQAYFKAMMDCASKFWQALIAVYAAAALLGIKPV